MRWDVQGNKEITRVPHRSQYDVWISRLTPAQIEGIKTEIRRLIREKGDMVVTAGWLPGSNWSNTPFHPIYEFACRFDEVASGKCFGLMVWVTLMEDEAYWGFGRYELNNLPIESMTYFKVHPSRQ